MKNLLICSISLCFLISCSADSDVKTSEINDNVSSQSKILLFSPAKKTNPFDSKGKEYYDALIVYQKQNKFPNSITEITDQIRFVSSQFEKGRITSRSVISFNETIVASIMTDPDNSMIQIVQSSLLGSAAKVSLINFLQDLIAQRQLEFSIAYGYIVAYEGTVLESVTMSEDDKETILTVTSISRYSLYSESERKDRDWEKSAGNRITKPFFSNNETSIISVIALLDKLI
jgi:hypothetical protein